MIPIDPSRSALPPSRTEPSLPSTASPLPNTANSIESLAPPTKTFFQKAFGYLSALWMFLLRFFGFIRKAQEPKTENVSQGKEVPLPQETKVLLPTPDQALENVNGALKKIEGKEEIIPQEEENKKPAEVRPLQPSGNIVHDSKRIDAALTAVVAADQANGTPEEVVSAQRIVRDEDKVIRGSISIFRRTTGYVGSDKQHCFSENIKLSNGSPITISPDDFICFAQITHSSSTSYLELPSSLFTQAKIDEETIAFSQDGQNYVLKLTPFYTIKNRKLKIIPFDDCFKSLKEGLKHTTIEFLHDADVPENYFWWPCSALPATYLSPRTKRVQLGGKSVVPLDFGKLKPILSGCARTKVLAVGFFDDQDFHGYQYLIAACGKPEIDVLLDRNYLHIHVEDVEILRNLASKKWTLLAGSNRVFHHFITLTIPVNKEEIDETGVSASLNDTGILTINISLFPKVR